MACPTMAAAPPCAALQSSCWQGSPSRLCPLVAASQALAERTQQGRCAGGALWCCCQREAAASIDRERWLLEWPASPYPTRCWSCAPCSPTLPACSSTSMLHSLTREWLGLARQAGWAPAGMCSVLAGPPACAARWPAMTTTMATRGRRGHTMRNNGLPGRGSAQVKACLLHCCACGAVAAYAFYRCCITGVPTPPDTTSAYHSLHAGRALLGAHGFSGERLPWLLVVARGQVLQMPQSGA